MSFRKGKQGNMSRIELTMVICLILIPIIALVIILPKKIHFKKKEKQPKQSTPKIDNPPEFEKVEQPKAEQVYQSEYKSDDNDLNSIRSYVTEKKKTTPPVRKNPTDDMTFGEYMSLKREASAKAQKQELTIKEQFDALSPEMKAIILAGAFDKKDYDDV